MILFLLLLQLCYNHGFVVHNNNNCRHNNRNALLYKRHLLLTSQQHQQQHRSSQLLFASPSSPEADEDEWKSIIAAFKMYKAAYGDLKVPSRFVVPAIPPWPKSAWNMKLGKQVAAMRSTGKYVQKFPKRRAQLEDMGFVWRVRSSAKSSMAGVEFSQVYAALETYKQQVSPELVVPTSFVVPNNDPWPETTRGLPLGKLISTIRTKTYLKQNPGAAEKLQELGFNLSGKAAANDARFQKVYRALQAYRQVYGDLLVPQPYCVPDNSQEFPQDTWGLRLGARVNAIRSQGTFVKNSPERRKLLDELGFAWSPPAEKGSKRRKRTKTSPRIGLTLQPDKSVAEIEVVPSVAADAFLPLKEQAQQQQQEEQLQPTWGLADTSQQKQPPMPETDKDDYAPPKLLSETLQEAKDRAIACGIIEMVDTENRMKKGSRDKDIPWFNDDFGDGFVFEDVVEALELYKDFFGNFSVPQNYVINPPSTDSPELEFDVEASARAAAAISVYEQEGNVQQSQDLISAEIQRLQDDLSGDVVISSSNENWPEHLAGMNLGNIVTRIRDGSLEVGHVEERRARLDEIGFDWGDPKHFLDVPFEKAMCAMYAYYLVRGDMFVREDFIVPDIEPWPTALAGYELGQAVKRLRELQNFMETYHIDKVRLLRTIDFMWFPNLALPLDPNEGPMTPEMLLVTAHGHPDYAKMIDIPMGLPEKIQADGPFYETDDPRQWWRVWHNWDYVKDYWYALGRRDNGYALRKCGYHMLADEHEAKYGPGMFAQMEETMTALKEKDEAKLTEEERVEFAKKLKYFREEMTDCRDVTLDERKKVLEDLDLKLMSLMDDETEKAVALTDNDDEYEEEELEEDYEYEEEEIDEKENEDAKDDVVNELQKEEYITEEEEEDVEELDIDDELGL